MLTCNLFFVEVTALHGGLCQSAEVCRSLMTMHSARWTVLTLRAVTVRFVDRQVTR